MEVLKALVTVLEEGAQPLSGSWTPDYTRLLDALERGAPLLAESDPSRGLYYLEWSVKGPQVTWFLTQAALVGPDFTDHFRWEWNQNHELLGFEFQTHFQNPLPGSSSASWLGYLRSFLTNDKN